MPCRVLRYPILGEFMGYIAGGDVVNQAPPVFCAYMEVLAALAADASGAQVGLTSAREPCSVQILERPFAVPNP